MKSASILMQQRTAFERWMRSAAACMLVFVFTACASQPAAQNPGPGSKVQTFHELMVKLKKGFDEGTLDTPDFYAQELGYPLERPETLKVIPPLYTPSRQIRFDSGELAGTVAYVRSNVDRAGKKFVIFNSANTTRRPGDAACVLLSDIQAVWGEKEPEPQVWGAHGPLPIRHYKYRTGSGSSVRIAAFVATKATGCIESGYSVGQYHE